MLNAKPKIVVVDDDLDNLDVLCCELFDFYEIYPVSDGFYTTQVIEDVHPDLILVNPTMSLSGGDQPFSIDHVHLIFGNIPILFITAAKSTASTPQLESCDPIDFISKPYDIDDVLTKIMRYLPSGF